MNPNRVESKFEYSSYYRGKIKKVDWLSYYHQIDLVIDTGVNDLLEIGGGIWVVSDFFRRRDYHVVAVDLNVCFQPDIVASVDALPLRSDVADCVLCCQVLEHLPYELFEICLRELYRITRKYVVMSLPIDATCRRIRIDIPGLHIDRLWAVRENIWKENRLIREGWHYWEIGRRDSTLDIILSKIKNVGWKVLRHYINQDNTNHYFFLLCKQVS